MLKKLFLFNFHRVSDEVSPAYPPMPIKTFDKVIKHLRRNFLIIPQEALCEKMHFQSRKSLCVITFDDAYYDFAAYALPVLEKNKVPVALHVISDVADTGKIFWTQRLNKVIEGYYAENKILKLPNSQSGDIMQYEMKCDADVERTALNVYLNLLENSNRDAIISDLERELGREVTQTRMLRWNEIAQLDSNLVSIGSHTKTHRNLMTLSDEEIKTELAESYNCIYRNLGKYPFSIAYPNGQYNDKINEMALATGYKVLYTCDAKPVTESNSCIYHRYNLYNREFWKNRLKIDLFRLKSTI